MLELEEWQNATPGRAEALRGVWLDDVSRPIVERLERRGVWRVLEGRDGLSIETRSFVGFVRLGSLELNIQPKLGAVPLAVLLRYALGLASLELTSELTVPRVADAMQDLLIRQLAAECARLTRRGLHKNYRSHDEQGQRPRGRLLFDELARRPNVASADVAYRYHDRSLDVLPNRVLLAGLRLASRIAVSSEVRLKTNGMVAEIDRGVAPIHLSEDTFRRLDRSANRLTDAYQPAFELIKYLYHGCGVALSASDDHVRVPGFLFDMNVLFQDVMGKFLEEHLPDVNVAQQHRITQMFEYQTAFNPRSRRAPTPRPDYVFKRRGKVVAIADAKYRDLWEKELPASMLYQLSTYALSNLDCPRATILYPTVDPDAREARIEIRDPAAPASGTRRAEVCLRPVNLEVLAGSLSGDDAPSKRRIRERLAQSFAFGD